MSKEKSVYEMYADLLSDGQHATEERFKSSNGNCNGANFDDGDDSEAFVTSEDIEKIKNKNKDGNMNSPAINDGVIEESVNFQRFSVPHRHRYTEKEMNVIRESCKLTIVHDYGDRDVYHISDEERAKNDELAELNMKLCRLKRTYRRADQYVEAMRIVFEAWRILERTNYIHTRDEFFEMVADGRIVSNRIIMPKLKRMDQYNIDLLIAYISNPELDASVLAPKNTNNYDDFDLENDESEEEAMQRLLSADEIQYLTDHMDNPEPMKVLPIKRKYIKGYDRKISKKKKQKGSKKERRFRESLAKILNKIQNSGAYKDHGFSFAVTNSMFDPPKPEKDIWDKLRFDGSWSDKNDVKLYEMAVNEELMLQHPPRESHLTYADKHLQKFYRTLEENGVNTIELRKRIDTNNVDNNKKKIAANKKENKKLESAIISRITALNNNSKFKKITKKAEKELEDFNYDE